MSAGGADDGFQQVTSRRKSSSKLRNLGALSPDCPGFTPPTASNSAVYLMRSSSLKNLKKSVQGQGSSNGEVWCSTRSINRVLDDLHIGQGVPHHIFLVMSQGNHAYGIARMSSRSDPEKYGGPEFWPDQFENAGIGNFKVQWIHQFCEPFSRLEHDPPLSTLPDGCRLEDKGFELCNILLKCPTERVAERVLDTLPEPHRARQDDGRGEDVMHTSVPKHLLNDYMEAAFKKVEPMERPALIEPAEASKIAEGRAASWTETRGLAVNFDDGSGEASETETEMEHIYIIAFNRHPREFEDCLHEGDELEAVRYLTESKGHSCRLPEGGSIFLHPEQHTQVRSHITVAGLRLGPNHVVVSETYKPLVHLAVSNLRSKLNVRGRNEMQLAEVPIRDDVLVAAYSAQEVIIEKHTFLCFTAHSMRNARSVTQSTGDVHTSVHPRQWCPASGSSRQ